MNLSTTEKAPSPNLIIPHFIFGGLSLVLVAFLAMLNPDSLTQHYFNPTLLALTHLLVLGFITMISIGALYQLIPVILEVKLYSEKMGWFTFFFFSSGILLLVVSFWIFSFNLLFQIAASFIFIAILLFKVNVILTSKNVLHKSIEKQFIITSIGWLFLTIIAGILFGLNFTWHFFSISHLELLKLHAHIGMIGWFMLLIMGVGSRLFPMFMLSYGINKKPLNKAYYFVNFGLILLVIALFLTLKLLIYIAALLIIVGIIHFLLFILKTYKKRAKKKLDLALKKAVLAVCLSILPIIILTFLLTTYQIQNKLSISLSIIYGITIFIGFFTMLIMGLTYKTLPFIIWLDVYKKLIGKQTTPLPKDLYSERILNLQFYLFVPSIWILLVGILVSIKLLIQIGLIGFFISALLYLLNIIKTVTHKALSL